MKARTKICFFSAYVVSIGYLLTAFALAELNPIRWAITVRSTIAIIIGIVLFLYGIVGMIIWQKE